MLFEQVKIGEHMDIKKPIIAGIATLSTLAPCKAQKSVEIFSEAGISGMVHKEPVFYSGVNFGIPVKRNYTDLFVGGNFNANKQGTFVGLALNNFSWTKNISSWVRETFTASNRGVNSTLEIEPVRVNAATGNFNVSFGPAYVINNDLKAKTTTQNLETVLQTTYTLTPSDKLFFEAAYKTEPAKNIFDTHFGKFKDNISYMFSYMRFF